VQAKFPEADGGLVLSSNQFCQQKNTAQFKSGQN